MYIIPRISVKNFSQDITFPVLEAKDPVHSRQALRSGRLTHGTEEVVAQERKARPVGQHHHAEVGVCHDH